jgi:hypothetical protein
MKNTISDEVKKRIAQSGRDPSKMRKLSDDEARKLFDTIEMPENAQVLEVWEGEGGYWVTWMEPEGEDNA